MPLCRNNNNEGAAKRCLVCSLVGVVFVWVLELIVGVCGAFSDLDSGVESPTFFCILNFFRLFAI